MTWDTEMASLAEAVEEAFGVSITIRKRVATTRAAATGIRGYTTTDTTVSAVRGRSRLNRDDGAAAMEEVRYSVRASLLSSRPEAGHELIDGALTYAITAVELSTDKTMYEIDCSRSVTAA